MPDNDEERHRASRGTDGLETQPHIISPSIAAPSIAGPRSESGTLGGSVVANVLRGVLQEHRSRDDDDLIGVVLDERYQIEKQIGEGGMGIVYLARHVVIDKAVAIKVLRSEVAANEFGAKRFVREARAASRIGHPNIVDVTDFGTTATGLTYQVMEFLEGQTLTRLIRSKTSLPLSRTLAIVVQIARALGAAHAKGIVHRDLKPDNVFLIERDGRDDFVKIVDFGIAKVQPSEKRKETRLTQAGTVFGTPEYMSPEQASGRTDVDSRADIYSLGIILYEMLVGKVPLRGDTTIRTLAMQILDKPVPPRRARPDLEISLDLEETVMRALEKDKNLRFQSMQDLLDTLEEVTSKTELDLALLLKQERISATMAQQGEPVDTAASPGEDAPASRLGGITGAGEVQRSNSGIRAATHGRHTGRQASRVTDPAFLRRETSGSAPILEAPEWDEAVQYRSSNLKAYSVVLALLLVAGGIGAMQWMRSDDAPKVAQHSADATPSKKLLSTSSGLGSQPLRNITKPGDAGTQGLDAASLDATGDAMAMKNHSSISPGRTIRVVIATRPRGGRLFVNKKFIGKDGASLSGESGTVEHVRCRLQGHREGTVAVHFDTPGKRFECRLRPVRATRCVNELLNPFGECPEQAL